MKREIFTAWITKYALTTGIDVVEAEWCVDISEKMISWGGSCHRTAHGNDWHRTPEAAISRAEEMRAAKIAAMRKQLTKLERMVFVTPNVRVEAGPTAGRQARAGENVPRTTSPGLVARRWASPRTRG